MTKDYEIHSDARRDTQRRAEYEHAQVRSVSPAEDMRTVLINRVSWGAVFAGVALAMVSQLILNLLGIGVGAAAFEPAGVSDTATGYSLGAAIWWAVAGIIAAFIGGFAAGRLCGQSKKTTAGWHGLTSWAVSILLIGLVMTTAAGTIVAGPLSDMMGQGGTGMEATTTTGATGTTGTETGEAMQKADEVSGSVAGGAFFAAIALLLGALASWWGSRLGAVDPTVTRVVDSRMDMPLH